LKRLFCKHRHSVLRVNTDRLFTECLDCLHQSPGITTGIAYPPAPRLVANAVVNHMLGEAHIG
jgi:hypothetical protein